MGVVEDLDPKVVDGQTMEEEETEEKESKLENGKETRLPSVLVVERQDIEADEISDHHYYNCNTLYSVVLLTRFLLFPIIIIGIP